MNQITENLKISPKLKRVLANMCNQDYITTNVICSEVNIRLLNCNDDDDDDMFMLISKCLERMRLTGYTDKVIHKYILHGFMPILFYFTICGKTKYDINNLNEFVTFMREKCQSGQFGVRMLDDLCNAVQIIHIYHDNGDIQKLKHKHHEKRVICNQLEGLIELYKIKTEECHTVEPVALRNRLYSIRVFLLYMEKYGVRSVEDFSHTTVSDSVTALSRNYNGGIGRVLSVIRSFLSFLFEFNLTPINYTVALPQRIPQRRKMRFGFNEEEISAILGCVNRKTHIGKRDYVIMLIAARMGLRACDIAALKLKDIDWHKREFSIVQQKTKVPLTLPLTAEVGNAVVDYFYNSRIKTDSQYMFPLSKMKAGHMKSPTISMLTKKYMIIAGVDDAIPYRGVHSFRRSFGKRLLDASLSPDILMEMLGQVNVNSITPYTAIYEEELRHCALSLESVEAN